LRFISGSAHAIGGHHLGPIISGLLRTTIREKSTLRDVAAMQHIADRLKTLGMSEYGFGEPEGEDHGFERTKAS
jgi:hypothetical protein